MLRRGVIFGSVLALIVVGADAFGDTTANPVDEARARAAGIRKLAGEHLTLYTDLPTSPDVDSLPAAFDAAVPLWAAYFGVNAAATTDWRVRAFLIGDRGKFAALGLMPDGAEFENGYTIGSDLWVIEQPTPYYRRHLLLHEGTHAFMAKFLGGCGPGWYMEGVAELLATHRWQGSKEQGAGGREEDNNELVLNIMPRDRREVPYLGRIKLIRDAAAADKSLPLEAVLALDNSRQLGVEAYAWCWAATKLLDSHPRYRDRFRALREHVKDPKFNEILRGEFADDWQNLNAEWQAYVAALDHGYDFERMAIEFNRGTPLDGQLRTATIAADRGWQSSGVWLDAGTTYRVTAKGRYQIGAESTSDGVREWPCEPGGITLDYYDGRPLGMLLGAVVDGPADGDATFARPLAIGAESTITPPRSGTLYLRVNDSAARLGDNRGRLTITVEP